MPKVRAIKMGFYGGVRRHEGEVFEVEKGAKAKWFVPAAGEDSSGPKVRGASETGKPSTGEGSDASGEQ
jgi:hypothetical protein